MGRQALHAWRLRLEHPDRPPETVRALAPPPNDFCRLCECHGLDVLGALAALQKEGE